MLASYAIPQICRGRAPSVHAVAAFFVSACCLSVLVTDRTLGAQERMVLRATVVDSLARPVAEATVRLSSPSMIAVTDSTGRFNFSFEKREQVSLVIAKVGYEPEPVDIRLAGRLRVDTTITIKRTAVVLSAVRVESTVPERYRGISRYEDFYERRRMAVGGSFFDREQLDRLGSMMRALNAVPGVRATEFSGRVSAKFARCTSGKIAVIIDGLYLPSLGMGDIRSNEVETLEVYTGVAQIPPVARGDACAAVIITTRMVAAPSDTSPH